MGYRFTNFFRLPSTYQLPKPKDETEPYERDDDLGNFETDESLEQSEFFPGNTCNAMIWSLMRNPIPDLPSPSYNRASHFFWCHDENCEDCQKNGKQMSFDPMPEWHRLFFAVNAKDSGTQYYRVVDLDEQIASLRETIKQIREFISKLSDPIKTNVDGILATVVEYDLPSQNRKIQWPADHVKNLSGFIEEAETFLVQSETAKQLWGDEAALYIDTDI